MIVKNVIKLKTKLNTRNMKGYKVFSVAQLKITPVCKSLYNLILLDKIYEISECSTSYELDERDTVCSMENRQTLAIF